MVFRFPLFVTADEKSAVTAFLLYMYDRIASEKAKLNEAHGSERQGVGGLYAEEQSCQQPSQADRSNNSDTKTDECHSQSVPHN
jgi:hypothetical protein